MVRSNKNNQNTDSSDRQHLQPKRPSLDKIGSTLKRIWQYMAEDKILFYFAIGFVLISSALSLLGPYLLGVAVDLLVSGVNQSALLTIVYTLVFIFISHSIVLWFQNYWMITVSQNTVFTMRNHLFSHLQKLSLVFFQTRSSGELMSRLTNDMENISRTLNSSVIQLATGFLTLIGTVGVMLWLSPLLTLFTLLIVPLLIWGMNWITNRTGRYFKEQQKNLGDMNGYIEETLSGHQMVKLFSQEERVINEFNEKNLRVRHSGYWAQVYSGFIPKVMNSLNNLSFTIIVGVGGVFALNGMISIGVIVTFSAYARQFTRPLNDLANQFNVILSAVAGAERVFDIIDEPEEEKDDTSAKSIPSIKGEVEFRSVSFSYQSDVATLKNINFHVNKGETIALVGPTGAGKTTIISLLSKFYEVERGQIFIDNHDITEITQSSLRRQIGVVLQDSFLFNTTVTENIRYGRLDASDEEIVRVAKEANAHSFITDLPNGYDTVLNADGGQISHGQRQLISIARAMLANPAMLILDEATSSIDTITEIKINDALKKLMHGRTSFIIAHRLNTVQRADKILVLEQGEIVEQGNHSQLLNKSGHYAALYHSQLGRTMN
ncbi:ABC transporter ATP-binding protein [Aquibacillus halophilus]|nr:ABC transporter ATP-binding protein [Aquibacillus halophilus]